MPTKGTINTPFRIPPDIKAPAVARAEADGVKLPVVVRRLLREYGAGRLLLPPEHPPDQQG